MAEKIKVMKKWFDDIIEDPNIDTTEQELAYIMYATLKYGLYGEKVNLGEVFGNEFKDLNRSMPNIYGQVDNIQNYDPVTNITKYDSEAIKECRLKGMTAKQICVELGYPEEKARSITTNKGWIEAGKMIKKEKNVKNCTSAQSQKSVQVDKSIKSVKSENTEKSENTDSELYLNQTEKSNFIQKSQNSVLEGFNF